MQMILFFLAVAASLPAQDALLQEWHEKWDNSLSYTLEVGRRMPDSLYAFRPTSEQMSFGRQLLHMASNINFIVHQHLGGPELDEDLGRNDLSKEEILGIVERAYHHAGRFVASLTEADLATVAPDFFAGPKTYRQLLNLLQDHQTHHRAQIIIYLRLHGIEPPRYVGW